MNEPNANDVYLETVRLRLRRFTPDDADALLELDSDPEVRRYLDMDDAPTRDTVTERTLPRFLAYYARSPRYGYWAAIEKTSGEFLGWFHFRPFAGQEQEIEVGYRLKRSAWNQGYATEGAKALIEKGFLELGARRIVATALAGNGASIRVMQKVGMTLEKRYLYDDRLAAVKYGLDRDDYLALP